MNDIKAHPAADLFPMMDDASYRDLVDDIRENGLQEDGMLSKDGLIVDGRNRYKACLEIGIEMEWAQIEEGDDFDPFAYAISKNLRRRHLTASQRAMIAAKFAKLRHGGDRKSEDIKGQICPSIEEASEQLNVSERSTKSAKKVIAEGSPEVIKAVEQGELPVSKAAELVKKVPDKVEQTTILKQGPKAISEAATKVTNKPTEVSHFKRFKEVWDSADEVGRLAIQAFVLEATS